MTGPDIGRHRAILREIARRAMIERGLFPDYSQQALAELDKIRGSATGTEPPGRDLRNLPWCSIDNDDSRDLDQLTAAEGLPGGAVKILIAIADAGKDRCRRGSRREPADSGPGRPKHEEFPARTRCLES